MASFLTLVCASCAVFCSGARCIAGEPVNCPDTINVRQQLTTAIAGWTTLLDDTPHRLASITFYDGRPEEKASLINDETARKVGKELATWHFRTGAERQIWIACGYAGTAVGLTRTLPPKINSCSVTYNLQEHIAGLPVIEKIHCQ